MFYFCKNNPLTLIIFSTIILHIVLKGLWYCSIFYNAEYNGGREFLLKLLGEVMKLYVVFLSMMLKLLSLTLNVEYAPLSN